MNLQQLSEMIEDACAELGIDFEEEELDISAAMSSVEVELQTVDGSPFLLLTAEDGTTVTIPLTPETEFLPILH